MQFGNGHAGPNTDVANEFSVPAVSGSNDKQNKIKENLDMF